MRAFGDNHASKANISEMGSTATNTSLLFYAGSSSAERMRIQENGDVGIGDYSSFTGLSPGSKLEIIGKSTTDEALKITHRLIEMPII